MRHVKFRFWSTNGERNVMLDWVCLMQTAFNCQSVADQHSAKNYYTPLVYRVLVNQEFEGHLMMWTGLQDSKGVDIYEGDLVEACSQGQHAICEVKWGIGTAGYHLRNERSGLLWYLSGAGSEGIRETVKVIGNIHENHDMYAETKLRV